MKAEPVSNFRLKLDIHILNYQEMVIKIMRRLSFTVSLVTIIAIMIYQGYYITEKNAQLIEMAINISLFFYVFRYFLLFFYSLKRKEYIKNSPFEFTIVLILILNFFLISIFCIEKTFSDVEIFNHYYLLFIQILSFLISLVELPKVNIISDKIKLSLPGMMLLSLFILILFGTLLLSMPRMSNEKISFIDALFTATSAGSVTGLSVLNIGQVFTLKGQIVILLLIQMGGLSILTFATFFTAFLTKPSAGLKYQHFVKDLIASNRLSDSFILLREIVITAFLIEAIGILMLFTYWESAGTFQTTGETFLYSAFHAISAFNNAGFSLWDANFMNNMVVHSYFPQAVIMLMVLLGGLGFLTISDLWNPRFRRERKKYPWKKLMPGTRIILKTTFFIILIGTIIFFLVEYNHSLKHDLTFFNKFYNSVFQIVVSRTSGFNTINVSHITISGMLLLMLLMFIGASPGSTGGGIKNTTLFVIIKSVVATVRGKKRIEFERKTIPFELVDKSYSIVVTSLILIFLSAFCLSLLEPNHGLATLLFESVSAFSTAGLSTGVPAEFSAGGKLVLALNMYIGRIGTLTLAFALSKRIKESRHQYPETYFMVG